MQLCRQIIGTCFCLLVLVVLLLTPRLTWFEGADSRLDQLLDPEEAGTADVYNPDVSGGLLLVALL
jgi:hypothetical protein